MTEDVAMRANTGQATLVDPLLDPLADSWADRLAALDSRLRELGSVVVAFSGGADSAFLLAAAVRALGTDRVVAATAISSSLPGAELAAAADFCASLGVRHVTPATFEMERDGYRANAGDRCYFCKAELLDVLGPLADRLGFAAVATGTNADDAVAGFRPGIRAAAERGAATPLLDAGLTKAKIRSVSRSWGLPTWDKPAAACLSSRIAFGIEVTPHRLARVDRAEVELRSWLAAHDVSVTDLRVRDLGLPDPGRRDSGPRDPGTQELGATARVELDTAALSRLAELPEGLADVTAVVRGAGFSDVHVDPRGFRSGSMNELLPDPAAYR